MSENAFDGVAAATIDAVDSCRVGVGALAGDKGGPETPASIHFLCPKCQNRHSKLTTLETHVMQCCPDRLRDVAIIGQKRVRSGKSIGANRDHDGQQQHKQRFANALCLRFCRYSHPPRPRNSAQKRLSSQNGNNGDGSQWFKQRKRDEGNSSAAAVAAAPSAATTAAAAAGAGNAEIADDESDDDREQFRTLPGSFVCTFCNRLISVEEDEMAFVCDGAAVGEECFCHAQCVARFRPFVAKNALDLNVHLFCPKHQNAVSTEAGLRVAKVVSEAIGARQRMLDDAATLAGDVLLPTPFSPPPLPLSSSALHDGEQDAAVAAVASAAMSVGGPLAQVSLAVPDRSAANPFRLMMKPSGGKTSSSANGQKPAFLTMHSSMRSRKLASGISKTADVATSSLRPASLNMSTTSSTAEGEDSDTSTATETNATENDNADVDDGNGIVNVDGGDDSNQRDRRSLPFDPWRSVASAREIARSRPHYTVELHSTDARKALLRCRVCNKDLAGRAHASTHDAGKKHQSRMQRCEVDTTARQRQLHEHIKSAEVVPTQAPMSPLLATIHGITTVLLKKGIPLSVLEDPSFRDILKPPPLGCGLLPVSRRSYSDTLGFLQQRLLAEDHKSFIPGRERYMSLYFDGSTTTNFAQATSVVAFYYDAEFRMHRSLLRLDLSDDHPNGESLASYLIQLIFRDLQLECDSLVAIGHDRASVNQLCGRILCNPLRRLDPAQSSAGCALFRQVFDSQCLSHGVALIGSAYLKLPLRDDFVNCLNHMMSESYHARHVWRDITSKSWKSKGMVRWFSHHELCRDVYEKASFLEAFLQRCKEDQFCGNLVAKALLLWMNSRVEILTQLAVGVDAGNHLAFACYKLEVDGANSHLARAILEELFIRLKEIRDGVHPCLDAIAAGFGRSADGELRIKREGRSYVQDSIAYYEAQFNSPDGDYYADMAVYEACELADPRRIVGLTEREALRRLRNFIPLYDRSCSVPESIIHAMVDSLPAYKLNAGGVDCPLPQSFLEREVVDAFDMQAYWATPANMMHFKPWVSFARSVMLIQTSSAAVERSFSALKRNMSDAQARSMLSDGQFVSVKMNVDKIIVKQI
jgi:hypothetical protein